MSNFHLIKELVDEIALEKPLDFESVNYLGMRDLAIQGALEQYIDIKNNESLNEEAKELSLLAILSYLIMENSQLWVEHLRNKK
jgi:hypothetical protein